MKTKPPPLTVAEFAYILENSDAPTATERMAKAVSLAGELAQMRKRRAGSKVASLDDYRKCQSDTYHQPIEGQPHD